MRTIKLICHLEELTMLLDELAEIIEELLEQGVPGTTEVHLGQQPRWPLMFTVESVIHTEEDGVIIVEGQNEGYGKSEWWSEGERC